MSDDPIDPMATSSHPASHDHEANGTPSSQPAVLDRDLVMLRARCSNLRHWCRRLLDDPATAGVLPEPTTSELLSVCPEVPEAEGQEVVALLAQGGSVSPTHPLAPETTDPASLRTAVARLSAERERLRQTFFALYDHLYPGDDLTDEYFLALSYQGPMLTMSEVIAEIEREFGSQT